MLARRGAESKPRANATSRFVALALAIGLAVWRAGGAIR
jgi:hypothetical protein